MGELGEKGDIERGGKDPLLQRSTANCPDISNISNIANISNISHIANIPVQSGITMPTWKR